MNDAVKVLLDDLDVISSISIQDEDWVKLDFGKYTVTQVSKPGNIAKGAAIVNGQWIPKSQMKCDFQGNIYIRGYVYSNKFS